MSVWYCIPSARPPEEAEPVLRQWRERGYKLALMRDPTALRDCDIVMGLDRLPMATPHGCARFMRFQRALSTLDVVHVCVYPGYSLAVNQLVRDIMGRDPLAEWLVTGGDDVSPDPNHSAEKIAKECSVHFAGTFGVMQPTGDYKRWPNSDIREICGSPWMGREFCRRINQGHGPMWPEYFHMFNDEELQLVALKYRCFWQRPDLIHHHEHWQRQPGRAEPAHLKRANSRENWDAMKAIFERRKAAGFPESEPIA